MEDILEKMFMFVMNAKRDEVLCIHIIETNEIIELSYEEVFELVFLQKVPKRFEIEA